jgi:flagellar motor protein MotB
MNRWMPKTLTMALAAALLMAFSPALTAAEPVDEAKLEAMARDAKSPADHAKVAKQYRLRAEAFEAKANKHEEEARKLQAQPRSPLEMKWPAMARKPWEREAQLAIEARRAAGEAYAAADKHIRLAVETQLAE